MSKSAEHAAEELQATIAGISTKDLVDELGKREGVNEIVCSDHETKFCIKINGSEGSETTCPGTGPARILVIDP